MGRRRANGDGARGAVLSRAADGREPARFPLRHNPAVRRLWDAQLLGAERGSQPSRGWRRWSWCEAVTTSAPTLPSGAAAIGQRQPRERRRPCVPARAIPIVRHGRQAHRAGAIAGSPKRSADVSSAVSRNAIVGQAVGERPRAAASLAAGLQGTGPSSGSRADPVAAPRPVACLDSATPCDFCVCLVSISVQRLPSFHRSR